MRTVLRGIKEAISTAFPKTEYQRCIVHQVRNTLKYVPDKDRKKFAADLRSIYQAADEKQALEELDNQHAARRKLKERHFPVPLFYIDFCISCLRVSCRPFCFLMPVSSYRKDVKASVQAKSVLLLYQWYKHSFTDDAAPYIYCMPVNSAFF